MARPIKVLCASEDVKTELRRRANGRSNEHRKRFRAEIILLRLQGVKIEDVATRLNASLRTVSIWSRRFETAGLDGLDDKPGRGRKPSIPAPKVARVITEATRPPKGRKPLEHALHGPSRRHLAQYGAAYLGEERPEAAPRQDLQAVERSEVRGEVLGRDRALSQSAGEGRWCCAATRRASVRRSNARNPDCRWRRNTRAHGRTTTSATARSRCSQRLTIWKAS